MSVRAYRIMSQLVRLQRTRKQILIACKMPNSFERKESSSELKKSCSELQERSFEFKESSLKLRESSSELKESSSELKESSSKLREISSELKESRSLELKESRSLGLKKSCSELQRKFKESSSELRESSSELRESSSELRESSSELVESSSELRESSSKLRESFSELRESSSKLRESFSELRASSSELRASSSELREDCLELNTESSEWKEWFYELKHESEEKKSCLNERACTLGKSCISPQNDKQTVTIRLTVRCKCRARNYKRRSRSREPSRIQVKKYVQILRKRKHRRKVKKIVKKSIPPSSHTYWFVVNFKVWYLLYMHRREYFFKNTLLRDRKKVKSKSFCFDNIKVNNSNVYANCSEQYCVSKTKLLLSNDVETNPGPNEHNLNNPVNVTFVPDPINLLEQRFNRLGMRPLDVGGRGDCFFRAVSHQLYGHPNNHWNIRVSGVEYMRENPERFIESNIESCWCDYLSSMSRNGTWADGLVIQAVADKLNLAINIIESNPYFSEFTSIQPVNPNQKVRVIYIGHMDEYHYVSSVSLDLSQQRNEYFKNYQRMKRKQINQKKLEKACNNSGKCIQRNRNDYFREYRKRRRLENEIQNKKETNKNSECSSTLENCKQKENDDVFVTEIFESHKSKRWSNHKYSEKAVDNLIAKFHVAISRGPLYICSCCDQ